MLKNLKGWLIAGAFALGMTLAYTHGYDKANTKWEREVHNEYVKRTAATADKQAAINAISKKYQEDLDALEGSTDRVIDDLRNDGKRLRVKLSAASRELQSNRGCFADGRAELDEEFSKRLIGVTQRGDLWIKSLQATIRELQRKEIK